MAAFDRNFTFFTIPAAFILLFFPKVYSAILGRKYFNQADPRKYQPAVSKADDLDYKTKNRILRAEAAVANGLETISLYAAAVVAVNAADVDPKTANALSIVYLGTRVAYNIVYVILQDDPRWGMVRSVTWMGGIWIILAMFLLAGAAVY
ncbi:uncharacterized protein BCR38DRAFT_386097 [Pseudomassariella vexata]|uniref:Membrane-associated, eicosanoid/glutathione metabolism protein n=1 Tax=Pseudomassariella vexata TaxID=1141098 RepID=A0A1Y2EAR8_9PEZI|nr:uncharacterized protein BCR38DRAFT_386097 [Pseudomassariella vexata]ORY68497.1 hypothetical protein BCR38DRAFT_386097 [Pseudomassariella vexata]